MCHVAHAGLKPARTLLGVPAGLLAVAPNPGAAGREGAGCRRGSKGGSLVRSGAAGRVLVCLMGWCGDLSVPTRWAGAAGQSWPGFCWASTNLGEAGGKSTALGAKPASVSCAETLPSVPEGFNRTVPGFNRTAPCFSN